LFSRHFKYFFSLCWRGERLTKIPRPEYDVAYAGKWCLNIGLLSLGPSPCQDSGTICPRNTPTGASANRPIRKLSEECVRTASGGETQVTGAITLPVEWERETKDLEFLIVPGLTQRFYFGINFWDTFGLTFLGKGGREAAAVETTPDFDLMTGDLDMNNTLKPETA